MGFALSALLLSLFRKSASSSNPAGSKTSVLHSAHHNSRHRILILSFNECMSGTTEQFKNSRFAFASVETDHGSFPCCYNVPIKGTLDRTMMPHNSFLFGHAFSTEVVMCFLSSWHFTLTIKRHCCFKSNIIPLELTFSCFSCLAESHRRWFWISLFTYFSVLCYWILKSCHSFLSSWPLMIKGIAVIIGYYTSIWTQLFFFSSALRMLRNLLVVASECLLFTYFFLHSLYTASETFATILSPRSRQKYLHTLWALISTADLIFKNVT